MLFRSIQSAAVYDPYSDGERGQIDALADFQVRSYAQLMEQEGL